MAEPRTPNWSKWKHIPEAELWEAVALSLDVDPDRVNHGSGYDGHVFWENDDFKDRLFTAIRNVDMHPGLSVTDPPRGQAEFTMVSLPGFCTWALSVEWDIPVHLEKIGKEWAESPEMAHPSGANTATWPWGDYETELLVRLREAAHEFWSTYDPDQPSTAPKNEEVTDWLVSKGVSKRVAEVMAQILRADRLPTGPRK